MVNGSSLLKASPELRNPRLLSILRKSDEMNKAYLQIQSTWKTPPRALALRPGGSTHWIGGQLWVDSDARRAKPGVEFIVCNNFLLRRGSGPLETCTSRANTGENTEARGATFLDLSVVKLYGSASFENGPSLGNRWMAFLAPAAALLPRAMEKKDFERRSSCAHFMFIIKTIESLSTTGNVHPTFHQFRRSRSYRSG